MHVLFEIDNGEEVEEFYFEGTPNEVRTKFLTYCRLRHVETVAVCDASGARIFFCDNTAVEPDEEREHDDTPCIEWNGFDRPGEY